MGKMVAALGGDGSLSIYQIDTGRIIRKVNTDLDQILASGYSSDGALFLITGNYIRGHFDTRMLERNEGNPSVEAERIRPWPHFDFWSTFLGESKGGARSLGHRGREAYGDSSHATPGDHDFWAPYRPGRGGLFLVTGSICPGPRRQTGAFISRIKRILS